MTLWGYVSSALSGARRYDDVVLPPLPPPVPARLPAAGQSRSDPEVYDAAGPRLARHAPPRSGVASTIVRRSLDFYPAICELLVVVGTIDANAGSFRRRERARLLPRRVPHPEDVGPPEERSGAPREAAVTFIHAIHRAGQRARVLEGRTRLARGGCLRIERPPGTSSRRSSIWLITSKDLIWP